MTREHRSESANTLHHGGTGGGDTITDREKSRDAGMLRERGTEAAMDVPREVSRASDRHLVQETPSSTDRKAFCQVSKTSGGVSRRILAVASAGGHWVQMARLREAFAGHDVMMVTTDEGYESEVAEGKLTVVTDANLDSKWRLARLAIQMLAVVLRRRPDVVVSTGAAPGYFALRFGKLVGAQTIWVDSIANAQELSKAGQKVSKYADLWLTQWPHLAGGDGPQFAGAVL